VHCEKESLLKPALWKENEPFSHTQARPPEAEVESVRDMIRLAAEEDFRGVLHICHVSAIETVEVIQQSKKRNSFRITCGVTPHHLLLHDSLMKREGGFILKVNPPLRSEETQKRLRHHLKEGKIDWIETDHAPHTYREKKTASGLPGFPVYPHLIMWLKKWGLSQSRIDQLTHDNIASTFGIEISKTRKAGDLNLQGEYDFDPYKLVNLYE
jgi:dihydroorotase